jgi:hypothetical protein
MRDCLVTGRAGYESIPFLTGKNVAAVELERVRFENLSDPAIQCEPSTAIRIKNEGV